jgi:hypothetical protein
MKLKTIESLQKIEENIEEKNNQTNFLKKQNNKKFKLKYEIKNKSKTYKKINDINYKLKKKLILKCPQLKGLS